MVGGRDSEEEEEAVETDGKERDLSKRVRRGRGKYWLTTLRSRYYRKSANRYKGDYSMQKPRCFWCGSRRNGGRGTNLAFSL